jgi:hypothetical protein
MRIYRVEYDGFEEIAYPLYTLSFHLPVARTMQSMNDRTETVPQGGPGSDKKPVERL